MTNSEPNMPSIGKKRLSALLLLLLSLMTGCAGGAAEIPKNSIGSGTPIPIGEPVSIGTPPVETPPPIAVPAQPTRMPAPTPLIQKEYMRHGFVSVGDVLPDALLDVRYYSSYNFVGRRIDGYEAPVILLTKQAADALTAAADELRAQGYVFKIFDGYRPQRAVDCFVRWAHDESDQINKSIFYPDVDKDQLLNGYIAKKSGHTRGSTVDLTLADRATGEELDMGTPFDYLSPKSNHGSDDVTAQQTTHRNLLKNAMVRHGFKPYSKEWWHYTLIDEPYPDTYFDFLVE